MVLGLNYFLRTDSENFIRPSFIIMAARAGAGVKDIQDQVGHKDPATTLRIYAQATVEGKQKVVDLVNFSEPAGEMVELPSKKKQQ